MSVLTYKVLHVLGIVFTFTALGAVTARALSGSGRETPGHKLAGITHGIALLVILISGFGFPLWVWIKIVTWLLLGAAIALVRRMPQHATIFWYALPLLGVFAAYLAFYKPF